MDLKLPFDLQKSPRIFLQRCGYAAVANGFGEQQSFVRRLSGESYPRFHIYLKDLDGSIILNLHLDQKRPSYPGAHAHSGEYDGQTVTNEMQRIQGLLTNELHNQSIITQPQKKGY